MTLQLSAFICGALTLGSLMIAIKFLKFWRVSGDRFFVWFTAAFVAFALGWCLRIFGPSSVEHTYYVYVPRLVGFVLIVCAIVDKNRRADRASP